MKLDKVCIIQLLDFRGFSKARIFLLVNLRDFFFRFRVRGAKKKSENDQSNDQLTGHFQSFSFLFLF